MEKSLNSKISFALLTLRPKAEWILRGDNYADLEWLDNEQTPPSWAEVEAEINNPTPKPVSPVVAKLAALGLDADDLRALGL
jgi:hypothetical protein